jgi:hypothetical protein
MQAGGDGLAKRPACPVGRGKGKNIGDDMILQNGLMKILICSTAFCLFFSIKVINTVVYAEEAKTPLYIDIPISKTSKFFSDGKLTSCPDKIIIELKVHLKSECFPSYTGKACSQDFTDIKIYVEGDSATYEFITSTGAYKKQNIFVPDAKGEFIIYYLGGTKYQYYKYGGSGCWGVSPALDFHVLKNNVEVGTGKILDKSYGRSYIYDHYLKKGLKEEIILKNVARTPLEIYVFLEGIPDKNPTIKKFLSLHPDYSLTCNNSLVPCSIQGDYDGDQKKDTLFSVKLNDNDSIKYFAAMGSGSFIEFFPCDNGLWKTIKKNGKDSVEIEDPERSGCILNWNGETLWGPLGVGD